jgi:hypothetical protein
MRKALLAAAFALAIGASGKPAVVWQYDAGG